MLQGAASLIVLAAGSAFVVSGIAKVEDIPAFERLLALQGLLPQRFALPVSIVVAVAEVGAGSAALALLPARDAYSRYSAMLLGLLLVLFSGYAVILDFHPPQKPTGCGCLFGGDRPAHWGPIAIRNSIAALLVLGAASQLVRVRRGLIAQPHSSPLGVAERP